MLILALSSIAEVAASNSDIAYGVTCYMSGSEQAASADVCDTIDYYFNQAGYLYVQNYSGYSSYTVGEFVIVFYEYVTYGYTVDQALDLAVSECFGTSFESCWRQLTSTTVELGDGSLKGETGGMTL